MSTAIYSHPGAAFYSELDNGETGHTYGVRILRKSDGVAVLARTTAGISEQPAGSGRYVAALTAPADAGAYTVLWDDGSTAPGHTADDDLVVTLSAAAEIEPPDGGGGLLSLGEYKTLRGVTDNERDGALVMALYAASERIKSVTGVDFSVGTTEARTFNYNGSGIISTAYFHQLISVAIDGVELGPDLYSASPSEGPPYALVMLYGRAPSPEMGFRRNLDTTCWWAPAGGRVTVTAEWGFPAGAPWDVKMAAAILTDEFAPAEDGDSEGVVARSIESYSVAFASNNEAGDLPPQAAKLLEPYTRPRF